MKNLLVAFFVFIAWEGHLCVEAQPFQQNRNLLSSVYNTTIAWSSFFDKFPKLWNSITTSLTQGSTAELNGYANQIQTLMQSGFADQNVQINEATPGLRIYQMEVRKALLYIGLPGTASILSSTGTSSNIVSYGLQTPFPIFVNQTGSVVGALSGDPTWFLGPHVCLTRTSAFNPRPDAMKNVTYCTSSRDESRMNVVCWLPTLDTNGSAISGTKYTTLYRCCQDFSLAAMATAVPQKTFPTLVDLLTLADRVNPPDNRICQIN